MPELDRLLSFGVCLGVIAVLARLAWTRFQKQCLWFFLYLLVLGTEVVLLEFVSVFSDTFGWIYFFFQSANLLVAYGVIREIYGLALQGHAGLAQFGRSVMRWALAAAFGAAGVSLTIDRQVLKGQSLAVHRFLMVERSGDMILLFLILIISVYLAWFPVKLRRNVVIYGWGFALFFAARSFGLLVINILPQAHLVSVSNAMLAAEVACLAFWAFGFRSESADQTTVTGHRWNPGEISRLSDQLDSINEALERFSRK